MLKIKNYTVTIISYHYVRPIKKSKHPNLKGLEVNDFEKQIKFLKKKFKILRCEEFLNVLKKGKIPKKPSFVLTFDDGYQDHYKYVFPILLKYKLNGFFYPIFIKGKSNRVLDVNKIQFILENQKDKKLILKKIQYLYNKITNKKFNIKNFKKVRTKQRFDDNLSSSIKRILQSQLPYKISKKIINILFKKFVNISEKDLKKKLYLNKEQILMMRKKGMFFGSHSISHTRLGLQKKNIQFKEISKSTDVLKRNIQKENISICYPFGSYNNQTLGIAKKMKYKFGLTNNYGSIDKHKLKNYLRLPRVDTNDVPK